MGIILMFLTLLNEVTFGENVFIEDLLMRGVLLNRVFLLAR